MIFFLTFEFMDEVWNAKIQALEIRNTLILCI